MPRYMFSRKSIVEEWFTVQAPDEAAALDMVSDGHPAVTIEQGEWIDWADHKYHLEDVEDELVTFTKGESING